MVKGSSVSLRVLRLLLLQLGKNEVELLVLRKVVVRVVGELGREMMVRRRLVEVTQTLPWKIHLWKCLWIWTKTQVQSLLHKDNTTDMPTART